MTAFDATRTTGTAPRPSGWRATAPFIWTVWAIAVAFVLVSIATARSGGPDDPLSAIGQGVAALSSATVGAILVSRLPRNVVGWLLAAGGLCLALDTGASGLADLGLTVHPGTVPGAIWFAWLFEWLWAPSIAAILALALVYPTGRLLSARWRPAAVALGVVTLLLSIGSAIGPWQTGQYPALNPVGVATGSSAASDLVNVGSEVLIALVALLTMSSIVLRYRRSRGVERAQLKWFAYVAAIGLPAFIVGTALYGSDGVALVTSNVALIIAFGGIALLPVAIGMAVLRYRLYDIDRLISRTLVYGVLAALLAGAYVGTVLVLSALLAPLTAENSLAVAGSTLLVAALFQPVRRRVQSTVDRRFNRAKYDAGRELAELSDRLLGEVDLEGVTAEVIGTVSRTLQPVSASIWFRTDEPVGPR